MRNKNETINKLTGGFQGDVRRQKEWESIYTYNHKAAAAAYFH
jgi:hypothetical protein